MVTQAMHKVQISNMKQIASPLWCCKRCNIMYTCHYKKAICKNNLQSLKVIQKKLFHKCLLKCVRHLHAW